MKFLIDECVDDDVTAWLKQSGYDVVAIIDSMAGSSDDAVLKLAEETNRILITLDSDFGELIFSYRALHHGVILVRLRYSSAENIIEALQTLFESQADQIPGNFITLTETSPRIVELRKYR